MGKSGNLDLAYLKWFVTQGGTTRLLETLPDLHADLVMTIQSQGDRCPGGTCLESLRDATTLGSFAVNASKGNGGAMRVAPIGIVYAHDPYAAFEMGLASARLTHGHHTGYIAAGAFAMMVGWLMRGCTFCDAIQNTVRFLLSVPGHEETMRAMFDSPWAAAGHER